MKTYKATKADSIDEILGILNDLQPTAWQILENSPEYVILMEFQS